MRSDTAGLDRSDTVTNEADGPTPRAVLPSDKRTRLASAWSNEMARAREARAHDDPAGEWHHLERAHILSQPLVLPHLRTHRAMLGAALRRHDRREVAGQLVRLLLAGPGSLTGRYPVGNTGGADIGAFVPMPIPADLRSILKDQPKEGVR